MKRRRDVGKKSSEMRRERVRERERERCISLFVHNFTMIRLRSFFTCLLLFFSLSLSVSLRFFFFIAFIIIDGLFFSSLVYEGAIKSKDFSFFENLLHSVYYPKVFFSTTPQKRKRKKKKKKQEQR